MIGSLVHLIIYLVVLLVVVALLLYVLRTAPVLDASIKAIIQWAIIVIACLIAILMLLNFVGVVGPISVGRL